MKIKCLISQMSNFKTLSIETLSIECKTTKVKYNKSQITIKQQIKTNSNKSKQKHEKHEK